MKRFCAALALLSAVVASSPAALAQQTSTQSTAPTAPTLVRLDGQLTTPTGEPRSGTVTLTVSLYAQRDDTAPLWAEQQTVELGTGGRYSIFAGATLPDGVPQELLTGATPARWIGVGVQSEPEQFRMMLVTVPYALKAREADTLAGKAASDFVQTSDLPDNLKAVMKNSTTGAGKAATTSGTTPGVAFTANYLLKDNGTGTGVDSIVYDNGTAVGIGTISPTYALDVNSGINVNKSGTVTSGFVNGVALGGWDAWGYPGTGNNMVIGGYRMSQWDAIRFYTSGMEQVRFDASGNVGIGTASPAYKLDVTGGGINVNKTGVVTAGFVNGVSLGGWDAWGYPSTGRDMVIGGYRASQWDGIRFHTSGSEKMRIDTSGNVGIGTTTPSAKLDVNGSVNVSGNIGAKYQDVAEWVDTAEPVEAGTLVIVDPAQPNRVRLASRAYDTRVAGAVSAKPGLILGEQSEGKAMIAQSGRVRVRADATYGAIHIGDLLVASATPGHVMRSKPVRVGGRLIHRPGTLVGKALEALPSGKGEILVLLTLQ